MSRHQFRDGRMEESGVRQVSNTFRLSTFLGWRTFLNSKLMAGVLAGTLVSTLVGQRLAAIDSLAGGAAIEAAGALIKIKRQKFALAELGREHPVSFIDDARTTLIQRHHNRMESNG